VQLKIDIELKVIEGVSVMGSYIFIGNI